MRSETFNVPQIKKKISKSCSISCIYIEFESNDENMCHKVFASIIMIANSDSSMRLILDDHKFLQKENNQG